MGLAPVMLGQPINSKAYGLSNDVGQPMGNPTGIKDMGVNKPLKSCAYCGDEFYSVTASKIYCCAQCRVYMCHYKKDPVGRQEHRNIYQSSSYQEAMTEGVQTFFESLKL
jgi:hypothetical protein